MGKGKNSLPDRWLDYISIGQEIRGVPIIACKVPLREDILRCSLQREHWFTPANLVEMVPNVGCIVDLTATSRYYNPRFFMERGIHHEKIYCAGHVVPRATTVRRFFQVVDEFLHNVSSRGKVLMVHCTHGLNRTGYLVSRYMVERRGFLPADAIAAFNEARGHCIERENYIEDLHRRNTGTDPVPLYQNSGAGYDDHDRAFASYEHQEERPTSSNGYNRYVGPARSQGHRSQRASKPSTATYQGRTKSPVPPIGYDARYKSSYYRNAPSSDAPAVPKHIRFTDFSPTHESETQMDYWGDRPHSANGDRSSSNVDQSVQKGGNARPISPAVQVVGERRSKSSVSSVAPSSKVRERSRSRRDVPDSPPIEVCYDSRLGQPGQYQERHRPSSREKPRVQRERLGSEQADHRASAKKMRHKTAKRLNAAGRSNNVD